MLDAVMNGFWAVLSIGYLVAAKELAFGTFAAPKAGFLPTLVGIAGVTISLSVLLGGVKNYRKKRTISENWRKFWCILIGLIAFLVLLQVGGYILATFMITLYLLKLLDTAGWGGIIFLSAGIAIVFYAVFVEALGIVLP